MKFILLAIFMVFVHFSFAQTLSTSQEETPFFAQGIFPDMKDENIRTLEKELRDLPFVKVVRLDINTKRFFILTKDISQLDELNLRSWFSEIGDELKCIQIGVQGIDSINPFPFVNCQN